MESEVAPREAALKDFGVAMMAFGDETQESVVVTRESEVVIQESETVYQESEVVAQESEAAPTAPDVAPMVSEAALTTVEAELKKQEAVLKELKAEEIKSMDARMGPVIELPEIVVAAMAPEVVTTELQALAVEFQDLGAER